MIVNARLTDQEFQKFSDIIYKNVGICLKAEKKELLNARLSKRLRACQIPTFKQYYEYISDSSQKNTEFVHFLDAVSTNFTSFFREVSHFDYLAAVALPELSKTAMRQNRSELKFWSAASSSGEEPYTLAMVIDDFVKNNRGPRVDILATDISTRVLQKASNGVYMAEQIEKVPAAFLKRYFQKGVGKSVGKVRVKPALRNSVRFQRFNLMDEFPWQGEMDVIFCRNVMIYFDRKTQQNLISKFYNCLRHGGYLFIGHSESIASIKHGFKQIEATTYRKL